MYDLNVKMYNYTKEKLFCTWQFGKIGVLVNLFIQKLKSEHLDCLSFWDVSRDPGFRILISVQKMWPLSKIKQYFHDPSVLLNKDETILAESACCVRGTCYVTAQW